MGEDRFSRGNELKVLLMAYECSPYRGSEWGVGWGRLLQTAREFETHVITSEANFLALERAREEGLVPSNVRFYTPAPDARLRSKQRKPVLFAYNYSAYNYWQKLALVLAKQLHAQERFDIVHQVNVCTFREPGYTWQLDIPYLWGPVGGAQSMPTRFLHMLSFSGAFKEGMRSLINWFSLHTKRRVYAAARASALIVAANSTNQQIFERLFKRKVELLLETGLHEVDNVADDSRFEARAAAARERRAPGPLHILWSGEMQSRKALPILLRALASLGTTVDYTLTVLGDGPLMASWLEEADKLGLLTRVKFLGRLPFPDAVRLMHSADLFCFTSLRDTSGNVVLEAMAAGVPVVCFDHQGAGDMVDDTSGVRLQVISLRRAVDDFAATIAALAKDGERLLSLSRGASARAKEFLWERNGDWINAAYRRLVSEHRASAKLTAKTSTSAAA